MPKRSISLINDNRKESTTEDSASIEEQVAEFLKSGGKIEKIASGVSGLESMATRQPKSLLRSGKSKKENKKETQKEAGKETQSAESE